MIAQDNSETISRYTKRFLAHGPTPEALGWRPGSQEVRFAAFVKGFGARAPASVVDLGCGLGDLLAFLRNHGWQGRYTGVDLVPDFITSAKKRFQADENAHWFTGDVLSTSLNDNVFEACFASGLCNHLRGDGNIGFIQDLIARGWSLTSRYFAIDFLSITSDRRREDLFFMEPWVALELGLRSSRRVELDHSYMPFEFMLKIYREDAIRPGLPYFETHE